MMNSNKARRGKGRWEPGDKFKERKLPILLETDGIESVKQCLDSVRHGPWSQTVGTSPGLHRGAV